MPIPIAVGVGAAQLLGQGINAFSQGKTNKKTRKWNEKMYGIQRNDALADYNMQNEYNSPAAQMARYKAAGLNPNLIYGQSNEGAVVRSTDAKSWNPQAPEVNLGGAAMSTLSAHYDSQVKAATIDNLKAQNDAIKNEAALKAAQIVATFAGIDNTKMRTSSGMFDLGLKTDLRDTSLSTAQQQLRKLEADTQYTINQDERAKLTNDMSLKQGLETILTMRLARAKTAEEINEVRARIKNLQSSTELNELNAQLQKLGINPSDPTYMRVLGRLLNGTVGDLPKRGLPPEANGTEGQHGDPYRNLYK